MLDDIKPEKFHEPASSPSGAPEKRVGHFRQILLWPVHLLSGASGRGTQNHAAVLGGLGEGNPWREVADEFTGDPASFQERHYNEFVTFLPPVQRFLYGNGRGRVSGAACGESPITVMRRSDITGLRVTLMPGAAAIELNVAHIDLYFFFDIDIAILALEVFADDVRLATAQDAMFRLGRAYPAFWEPGGAAGHCPVKVELISANGSAVAASDYQDREAFLAHVGEKRAARIAAHWEYLLRPMVPHDSNLPGRLRYKQLEYYRMPQMALLAVTGDTELTRADYVRLAFASGPGDCNQLPFADRHLADFEQKYCYDRYFGQHSEVEWPESRYMSCGHALVVTGSASNASFTDLNHGCLNSFRHEHFLVFLISHFHKAALLMFSDRLTEAMSRLDSNDKQAVESFRAQSRLALETFLRFTHRYWFHEVSNQTQAHDLFELCRSHLHVDRLYDDVRQEIQSMSEFLENEALRRQSESMTRLTVVTTLGLIGTTVTGFLGMNILAWADQPVAWRVMAFLAVLAPTIILTLLSIASSRRLAGLMEWLSGETSNSPSDKN